MSKKMTKSEAIIRNLLYLTGKQNMTQLGMWLYKDSKPASKQYFARAKCQGYELNCAKIIERCIEEGLDLNAVFGNTGIAGKFEGKLDSTEKQVRELLDQNKVLQEENRKYMQSLGELTMKSQELTLKYIALVNKK